MSETPNLDALLAEDTVEAEIQTPNLDALLSEPSTPSVNTATPNLDALLGEEKSTPWLPEKNSYGEEAVRVLGTAAEGIINAPSMLLHEFGATDERLWDVDITEDPESIAGNVASTILQFAVPFTQAMKGAQALTWGAKLATSGSALGKAGAFAANSARASLVAGGTGALIFEHDDPNVANALRDHLGVKNALVDFLATSEDDPAAVNRLKTVVADTLGGPFADVFMASLPKALKFVGKTSSNAIKKGAGAAPQFAKDFAHKRVARPIEKTIRAITDRYDVHREFQDLEVDQILAHAKSVEDGAAKMADGATKDKALVKARKLRDKADGIENNVKEMSVEQEGRMLSRANEDIDQFLVNGMLKYAEGGKKLLSDPQVYSFNNIYKRLEGASKATQTDVVGEFEKYWKYSQAKDIAAYRAKKAAKLRTEADAAKAGSKKQKQLRKDAKALEESSAGIPRDEWKQGLRDAGMSANNSILKAELKNFESTNKALLEILKDSGTLSAKDIKSFNSVSKYHAYFFRTADDADIVARTKDKAKPTGGKSSVKEARKLSPEESLRDMPPLENMYVNYVNAVKRQMKFALTNKFKLKAFDQIKRLDHGDDIAELITKGTTKEAKKGQHIEKVFRNGVEEQYIIKAPDLAASMKSLAPLETNPYFNSFLGILRPFKRYESKSITTYDPVFVTQVNLMRDIAHFALLAAPSKSHALMDLVKASGTTVFKPAINKAASIAGKTKPFADDFGDTIKQGMGFGHNLHDIGTTVSTERIGRTLKEWTPESIQKLATKTPAERLRSISLGEHANKLMKLDKSTLGTWMRRYEDIMSRLEYLPRQAQYDRLIKNGYSERKAGFMVRDLMDFSNTGTNGLFRQITSVSAFTNTWAQGVYRWSRAMGVRKLMGKRLNAQEATEVANVYRRLGKLSIAYMMVDAYNENAEGITGDKDVSRIYNDIAPHIGFDNTVIVTPKIAGYDNAIFTIPVPFEFAILPNAIKIAFNDYFTEPEERKLFQKYMLMQMGRLTSIEGMSMIPSLPRTILEHSINEDLLTGAPIQTEYELSQIPQSRVRANTSTPAKFIADFGGEFAGLSPVKLDRWFNFLLPGIVGKAFHAIDEEINSDRYPAKAAGDTYLTGRSMEPTHKGGRNVQLLREMREKAEPVGNTIQSNMAKAEPEARQLVKDMLANPEYKRLFEGNMHLKASMQGIQMLYKRKNSILARKGDPQKKLADLTKINDRLNSNIKRLVDSVMKGYERSRAREEAKNE